MTNFFVAAHALIEHKGKFLVTRRSEVNDYLPLTWDVPGGTADAGESIEEALAREIKEETGLKVDVIRPLHIYTNLSQLPQRQTFQIVFKCKCIAAFRTDSFLDFVRHITAELVTEWRRFGLSLQGPVQAYIEICQRRSESDIWDSVGDAQRKQFVIRGTLNVIRPSLRRLINIDEESPSDRRGVVLQG